MISFNAPELSGLLESLRDCPGRISAVVVPGRAESEALVARLQDLLPELSPVLAADGATPGELGSQAKRLGDEDHLFVVPVDGRRFKSEKEKVDFWRGLNYQRERLASGAVRTCLIVDAENEKALAVVADDLWDWAIVFRFSDQTTDLPPLAVPTRLPVILDDVDPDLKIDLEALGSRLTRAQEVRLPADQLTRDFAVPYFVKLADAGRKAKAREIWEIELRNGHALTDLSLSEEQESEIHRATRLIGARVPVIQASPGIVVTGGNIQNSQIYFHPGTSDDAGLRDRYLRWVMAKTGFLHLTGVDPAIAETHPRLRLEAIYTALLARSSKQDGIRDVEIQAMTHGRDGATRSALELLDAYPRVVLLGDPGSGKSTFLAFVALCMAGTLIGDEHTGLDVLTSPIPEDDGSDHELRQQWSREALLPVRIVLRDFMARGLREAPTTARDLYDFAVRELRESMLEDFAPSLRATLEAGEAIILLDGLDEVPDVSNRRELVCEAIFDFVDVYPACRYVVTSRPYTDQKAFRLRNFKVAELEPFGDGQIRRFTHLWYEKVAELCDLRPEEAAMRATVLERAIFANRSLRELAERPLLLTLMASLHAFRGGSLPTDRERLYDDSLDLLLDVWEQKQKHRDGQIEPSLMEWLKVERKDVLKVLQGLAFMIHAGQKPTETGTADIPAEKLIAGLMRISPQTGDILPNPVRLAEYLSHRAGLLVKRAPGVYTFLHHTFQEYLAARHLVAGGFSHDDIAKLGRSDPARWREVVLLAAARIGPLGVWDLADALAFEEAKLSIQDAWGLHLASQALVETADLWQVNQRNKSRLDGWRGRMARLLESSLLPAGERAVAGTHLAKLGDPRFDEAAPYLSLDSAAGFVSIPGGSYPFGTDDPQIIELPSFYLARYPVTVAQYQTFVEASGLVLGEPDALRGIANHPVAQVSWDEAMAYGDWLTEQLRKLSSTRFADDTSELWRCIAAGELRATLPTEAQWEAAARGTDSLLYPWGNEEPTPEHANFAQSVGSSTTVGIYPKGRGPFGIADQAGNIAEWCADVSMDGTDPKSSARIAKGGSWWDNALRLRVADRVQWTAGYRSRFRGFRICLTGS